MRRKFRIYLAGRMTGRDAADVSAERRTASLLLRAASDSHDVEGGLDMIPVDPAEGEVSRDRRISADARENQMSSDRFMVERDLALVKRCDAVLVLTADTSRNGTIFEWGYARYLGRPVFAVTADEDRLGSWRRAMATACGTLEEMVAAVASFALSMPC